MISAVSPATSRTAVFALAAVLASAIAFDLWRMPVQPTDALSELLDAQASPSVAASFASAVGTTSYLRPLRIAQIKALFDLSRGHYHLAYRGFHGLLIVALVLLFVNALQVQTAVDAAAAMMALVVLTGLHTFLGFLREAFPINHFLEVAVLAMVALNLTLSRGSWWSDILAAVTFVIAALTLESGILIWVVVAAAWLIGLRGVSTRGVVVLTLLLGAYFFLRFWYLDTGIPSLTERSSGFLLERLEPAELQRRFGATPMVFYAYNVGASLLSLVGSEPRDGMFVATRAWLRDDVHPQAYLSVASSLAMTMVMVFAVVVTWRRDLGRSGRLAIVALIVILANAVLSFSYAKDDIIALGGVFYAVAAYVATRAVVEYGRAGGLIRAAVVSMVVLVLASAWAMRSSGVHHVMTEHAFRTRNDWAELPLRWQRQGRWPSQPERVALIGRLRDDALDTPIPNPEMLPEWRERWYGD